MARYLSGGWFETLERYGARPGGQDACVVRHVVTGTPEGEVRYQVVVGDDGARVRRDDAGEADLTFTSDYRTAAAITRGELSTESALLAGKVRVAGNVAAATPHLQRLAGQDLLPPPVRETTTF